MQIQVIDNVRRNIASVLIEAITRADDVRIAVAYVSSDGLSQIMPSVQTALDAGASVEFLVGIDARLTDPHAIRALYDLSCKTAQTSLLCFASLSHSAIYHPKMYLIKREQAATAIIGSSNLTRRGLTTNIEVNLAIEDDIHSETLSDIYTAYNRLKYHPDRVVPDDEFVNLFTNLCHAERSLECRLKREAKLREMRHAVINKAKTLQRPRPRRADLIGWLELVYDVLPENSFTNQRVYEYEEEFRRHYPQNLNIRAKIRQQLQILQKWGFIEHQGRGTWRKVD